VAIEHRKLEAFGDRAAAMKEMFETPHAWGSILDAYATGILPL
jgi:hypothetical protein